MSNSSFILSTISQMFWEETPKTVFKVSHSSNIEMPSEMHPLRDFIISLTNSSSVIVSVVSTVFKTDPVLIS